MEYFPAVKAEGEYKIKSFDNAASDYKKALEYKPNWNDVTFNLGNTYFRQKKYDEAETEYNKIVETGKESLKAQALYNLGNIAYKKGDLKKAEELYKKSLRINPKDKDAKYNLELCKKEQEKNAFINIFLLSYIYFPIHIFISSI
ncbi:tetratricopeptide repeat protein, partial [bacterium]|nr:tetratricopeptide repeat protein [bacterium]